MARQLETPIAEFRTIDWGNSPDRTDFGAVWFNIPIILNHLSFRYLNTIMAHLMFGKAFSIRLRTHYSDMVHGYLFSSLPELEISQ